MFVEVSGIFPQAVGQSCSQHKSLDLLRKRWPGIYLEHQTFGERFVPEQCQQGGVGQGLAGLASCDPAVIQL